MTDRDRTRPPAPNAARFRAIEAWRKARVAAAPSETMVRIAEAAMSAGRLRSAPPRIPLAPTTPATDPDAPPPAPTA